MRRKALIRQYAAIFTADIVSTTTRDANGDVILIEDDLDADGTPEVTTRYTRGAQGELLKVETDSDGDGVNDSVTTNLFICAE